MENPLSLGKKQVISFGILKAYCTLLAESRTNKGKNLRKFSWPTCRSAI